MAKNSKKEDPVKKTPDEKTVERVATLEEVLGGILKQLSINNRILADIHARLFQGKSMAGCKAEPFKS